MGKEGAQKPSKLSGGIMLVLSAISFAVALFMYYTQILPARQSGAELSALTQALLFFFYFAGLLLAIAGLNIVIVPTYAIHFRRFASALVFITGAFIGAYSLIALVATATLFASIGLYTITQILIGSFLPLAGLIAGGAIALFGIRRMRQ